MKTNKDIIYEIYLRCDPEEIKFVDSQLNKMKGNFPRINFRVGIEFPSNRMLSFMKKGINLDNIINAIKMFNKYDNTFIRMYILLITSWPNLIKDDLFDFHKFKDAIVKPVGAIVLSPLFCSVGTEVHKIFETQVDRYSSSGLFYKGYIPKISDEVKAIDNYMYNSLKDKASRIYTMQSDFANANSVLYKLEFNGEINGRPIL